MTLWSSRTRKNACTQTQTSTHMQHTHTHTHTHTLHDHERCVCIMTVANLSPVCSKIFSLSPLDNMAAWRLTACMWKTVTPWSNPWGFKLGETPLHRDCYQSYTNKRSLEQIADDAGTQLEMTTLRAVTATWKMKTQQQNHAACRRIGQACQQDTCTRRTTDAFLQLQLVHFCFCRKHSC